MGQAYKLEYQTQLINAIKSNDSIILKEFYVSNYPKIETLILKNSGSAEHAKDIYQDAFITIWKHVRNDTFIPQNETALEGYLYRIAKNKWTDVLRSKAFKNSKPLNAETLRFIRNDQDEPNDPKSEKIEITMDAFKNLGQPCKQLLKTFYFDKKSLKDIASELKIEETTARNKKYRCMEKLRAMVLSQKN
jgi:RNA polymerase sigma factor (sigma-70 family)